MNVGIQKKTFVFIFLLLAIMLLLLPFFTTTSGLMTSVFAKFGFSRFIADVIVPYETRSIAGLIQLFGYQVQASAKTVSIFRNGNWETVWISWNCIGWQSLILFGITLIIGLQGNFSKFSKVTSIALGLLGTFLINLIRITLITYLIFNFNQIPATILHDYFSAFVLIIWLFFFWWFVYSFVLEDRREVVKRKDQKG